MAEADESSTLELGRHVNDIIGLIERNSGQSDFIQFRLDWLYNAVVRYCDNIPSGEAVMALIQEATELFTQSEDHSFRQNFSFQAKLTTTGERGRPLFVISRDQLYFNFNPNNASYPSFASSRKLRLKREVLPERVVFTLRKQICSFLNEGHYRCSRRNIVTVTHNSIIQPVETLLCCAVLVWETRCNEQWAELGQWLCNR